MQDVLDTLHDIAGGHPAIAERLGELASTLTSTEDLWAVEEKGEAEAGGLRARNRRFSDHGREHPCLPPVALQRAAARVAGVLAGADKEAEDREGCATDGRGAGGCAGPELGRHWCAA